MPLALVESRSRTRGSNRGPGRAAALRFGRSSDPIPPAQFAFLRANGSETIAVGDDSTPGGPARDAQPVTQFLHRIREGDRGAKEELAGIVYEELKRIAARAGSGLPRTPLCVTELAHEAWIRLFGADNPAFVDRRHLFSAAARAMRCVLIDAVRADGRHRDDGNGKHVPFDDHMLRLTRQVRDPVALNEELKLLATQDPVLEELVNLHFVLELTMEECAALLDVPLRTLQRHWQFAKAWLHERLSP